MSPTEAMFVLFESPSHPMHVATLTLYDPPTGTAPGAHAADMVERLRAHPEVSELFRKRPVHRLHGYPWWRLEKQVDLGYHVRHTAVPGDGTIGDPLSLVSQMHSMPLDPQHPMWERHVIEGLTDGRTAVGALGSTGRCNTRQFSVVMKFAIRKQRGSSNVARHYIGERRADFDLASTCRIGGRYTGGSAEGRTERYPRPLPDRCSKWEHMNIPARSGAVGCALNGWIAGAPTGAAHDDLAKRFSDEE
jgi:hypothetical protein